MKMIKHNKKSSRLKTKLLAIIEENPNTIKEKVCQEALVCGNSNEEITNFFNDLSKYGCVSGMISFLVWYSDTHTFFDNHYEEIEELREEFEESTGLKLEIKGDLKNFLAWFSFEETAYQIANELNLF
jgi:hypothetical protein